MTTIVSTSNTEVTTPASYVSRWIAQSHGKYQKKSDEYYSSLCDYRTSIMDKTSTITNSNSHTTTWQAQAKSRLNTTTTNNITSDISVNDNNNNEIQEKLNRIR
jgi:hypothetical protein